jgi:pimeloyl-ACP methyl ester carboxylesterase
MPPKIQIQIQQNLLTTTDNATISYLSYTPSPSPPSPTNPGLIILHGGLSSHYTHTQLAASLCSTLSIPIYLPDRRGRGASSPPGNDYSMQTEINDLHALLRQTGARSVLGISSGAMIALYAALSLNTKDNEPNIKKLAIFEPSIILDNFPLFEQQTQRFEREIDDGKIAQALITALSITGMGGWFLRWCPRFFLVLLAKFALFLEHHSSPEGKFIKRVGGKQYSMRNLASTLRYDFQLVKEMQGTIETLKALEEAEVEVLLMSGGKSPGYLRRNVRVLGGLIPGAKVVEWRGLDHLGLGNGDVGGRPEVVVSELGKFLV